MKARKACKKMSARNKKMKARRVCMKIKVRKASKKLKARRAHKKMKACIRQRHKGTQARKAPGRVEHIGTRGT